MRTYFTRLRRSLKTSLKYQLQEGNMDKARELQQRMCQAFEEYFGSRDPVFNSPRMGEASMNAFLEWFSYVREIPGKEKTPAQFYLEEHGEFPPLPRFKLPGKLIEAGEIEVGFVFDEVWGVYILPYYGEVKEVFTGNHMENPDYEDLLRALVNEESFIPPFIIKRLIEGNPEKALKAYSSIYNDVNSLDDLYKLYKRNRTDWEEEPKLSVMPVRW
jgi:hypothetical protein